MINIYLHAYLNMVYISCVSVDVLSRSCRCEIQQNFTILKKRHMNCLSWYPTIYEVSKTILTSPYLVLTYTKYAMGQKSKSLVYTLMYNCSINPLVLEHKITISILIKCVNVAKSFSHIDSPRLRKSMSFDCITILV